MKKKKRNGPGRPEGESFAREKILKAAEIAFAEHGYAGTSLREIVKRAHVTQALVTYYFGSKDALFKEVAHDLEISPHTVKTHLERIFEKLGANDRAQAVAIALRKGLVD